MGSPSPGFTAKSSHSYPSTLPFLDHSTNLGLSSTHIGNSTQSKPIIEKPAQESKNKMDEADKGRSKILFQVPDSNKGSGKSDDDGDGDSEGDKVEEMKDIEFAFEDKESFQSVNTWKLRPRKPVKKPSTLVNASGGGGSKLALQVSKRGGAEKGKRKEKGKGKVEEEGEKRNLLSIVLTKKEIEEDFVRMTGIKPPKKPVKRAKNVQRQIDVIQT